MEMLRALLSLAAAAVLVNIAMAADYTVGAPSGGWDLSTNLQAWASSHTFHVGDNLIFKYTSNHDVVEVKEADYGPCQASNPIQRYTGGNTVIGLASLGKRYFICGVPGHCDLGMKVEINTLAAASAPPPAATPPPEATPSTPPPATPPPEATPSTPPPASPAPASPVAPVSSPPPVNPPKSAPTTSPPAPSMSPTSIPASSPNVPSAEPPTSSPSPNGSAPPPSFSSAPKANTLVGWALGFCFSMAILLAL
ncbi:classical arabinogalactan protein 9-like [Diospyros lotus]|uniref:classical arabinogalactan protein 9-like n=1 Tax=Diospyros lotus TaxID=55363 RepID=UPI002256F1EE|nr:classical arabinogalactan protein 9-like [Diospyros lotus]